VGSVITIAINIIFVPVFSYMASAWASFACYFVMMLISYFLGQKYMPIKYDLKTIGIYTLVTLALYGISLFITTPYLWLNLLIKTILLFLFVAFLIKRDFPLQSIPVINRYLKKS
jgi:O-antigen/teichoic acid export membrane protein